MMHLRLFMVTERLHVRVRNLHIKITLDNQVFICFRIKIKRRFNLAINDASKDACEAYSSKTLAIFYFGDLAQYKIFMFHQESSIYLNGT